MASSMAILTTIPSIVSQHAKIEEASDQPMIDCSTSRASPEPTDRQPMQSNQVEKSPSGQIEQAWTTHDIDPVCEYGNEPQATSLPDPTDEAAHTKSPLNKVLEHVHLPHLHRRESASATEGQNNAAGFYGFGVEAAGHNALHLPHWTRKYSFGHEAVAEEARPGPARRRSSIREMVQDMRLPHLHLERRASSATSRPVPPVRDPEIGCCLSRVDKHDDRPDGA